MTSQQEYDPNEPGFVNGLFEYEVREAINALIALIGFDATRALVAEVLLEARVRKAGSHVREH